MKNNYTDKHHHGSLRLAFSLLLIFLLSLPGVNAWADENQTTAYENEQSSGYHLNYTGSGEQGEIHSDFKAGINQTTSIAVGPDGLDLASEIQVGLSAELQAISTKYNVGNEDVNLSAQGQAKLEALLGAEGKINAHIDEKGISIGVDAKAGAYVSASAEATFGATVFGLQANIIVSAEAHAGAKAEGSANVTIGFDGKIKFELGAGLAIGIGASAALSFDLDASELMAKLGLRDISGLIAWIEKFIEDPAATINDLKTQAIDYAKDKGYDFVKDFINRSMDTIRGIPESLNRIVPRYGNWCGPGLSGGEDGDQCPKDSLDEICIWHDFAYAFAKEKGKTCGPAVEQTLKAMADNIAMKKALGLMLNPEWERPPENKQHADWYLPAFIALFYNTARGRLVAASSTFHWTSLPALLNPSCYYAVKDLKAKAKAKTNEWYSTRECDEYDPASNAKSPIKDTEPYIYWLSPDYK